MVQRLNGPTSRAVGDGLIQERSRSKNHTVSHQPSYRHKE